MIKLTQTQEKSLNNASITVYLSLLLLILLSFLCTSIEAARITAAKGYLVMLAEMASDSLKGTYFYPLFEEYALLAVDAGYKGTDLDIPKMSEFLKDKLEYSESLTWRGLITMENSSVNVNSVHTLLDSDKAGFAGQIKDEIVYEGAELLLGGLGDCADIFDNDILKTSREQQQEAAEAAGAVAEQILTLMECVDGIATTETGLAVNGKGEIFPAGSFVKCFGTGGKNYMQSTYGNPKVYDAVENRIIYPESVCMLLDTNFDRYDVALYRRDECEKEAAQIKEQLDQLAAVPDYKEEEIREMQEKYFLAWAAVNECEKELSDLQDVIKEGYILIKGAIEESLANIATAMAAVKELSVRQATAAAYSINFENTDYDTNAMLLNLKSNKQWLEQCMLPEFDTSAVELMKNRVGLVMKAIKNITYDALHFNYGVINTSEGTGQDVEGVITKLIGGGILELIGIEEVSKKEITGVDLPSGGIGGNGNMGLYDAIDNISELFQQENVGEIVNDAVEAFADSFATEVYLQNNFSIYTEQKENTKLAYEREYVLFGNKSDEQNLNAMALRLAGFRTALSFLAVFTDTERINQAEALGKIVAGLTGIAPLLYVIKYLILTVWAIEEALVEVCALFMGKAVALFSQKGHVNIGEILLMTPTYLQSKVDDFPDYGAPTYTSYVTFLSLLENVGLRNLRAMDLIQENMRSNYRDSFRIRNCVTEADFVMNFELIKKFNTGFFKDNVYKMSYRTKMSYAEEPK